jgi:3-polyprenyl-4-hydroxybenzoate decarboxylase
MNKSQLAAIKLMIEIMNSMRTGDLMFPYFLKVIHASVSILNIKEVYTKFITKLDQLEDALFNNEIDTLDIERGWETLDECRVTMDRAKNKK